MPRKATAKASTSTNDGDAAPKRGTKRKSTDHESTTENGGKKKAKPSEPATPEASEEEEQRPRLTSPDLEFDYDRSQLRDPRATPGRVRRPRLEDLDRELTKEFRERFTIPEVKVPKRGCSAAQKEKLYEKQALVDPTATFHDLNVCYKKGPGGSPTYDSAGFQLDYDKVAEWKKPQRYNKSRIMKGMDRSLARAELEEREIFETFFVEGKGAGADVGLKHIILDYVKDHISKDLGVPWHQIGPKQAREWQEKGFEKKKFSEWWCEPNEEENKRMSKMMTGASLRKDL
ncbi:hypothetical protein FHL15_005721 [Xylaria flabelliformis]|uniref:Uncharacterized protein n=1 Tax=Xylaria flabelliformis TaxID=2512241 RepID=A0A553HZR0_9PEZI|nr:hypothetical protein FHL15_005721 [Xylaria flabelliformis]